MKNAFERLLRGLGCAVALAAAVAGGTAMAAERSPFNKGVRAPAATQEDPTGARVIVKYRALGPLMRAQRAAGDQSGPQHAATMSRRLGLALTDGRVIDGRTQVLRSDRSLSSAALAARLAADADVEYAVPDLRRRKMALPNDPLLPSSVSNPLSAGQWYLAAPDATFAAAINAVGAWDVTTGSAGIVVADIDTGVLPGHPDLANKLVAGYDFIADLPTSVDGDARDGDPTDPGDWTTAGECGTGSPAESSSWHGTQTSSIIGARTNNGVGMASVGYNVKVQPSRVLGKCGGYDSDILAAMLWAGGVSNVPYANPTPARVLNLSLGGEGACTTPYADAVSQLTALGVVVVAAAGNEGLAVGMPANCSGVIAVAALRHTGIKVDYSNFGPQIAISAPGGNCVNLTGACLYPILTATNSGTTTANADTYSDSSNFSVGTSFAAPMVSGAVALMLSVNPSLTVAQVTNLLKSSARAFPSPAGVATCPVPSATVPQDECTCTTSTCGAGMLDVSAAVTAAAATAVPTARVSTPATTVTLGSSVTFDGSASTAPSGRTIASYAWTLSSGAGVASFSSVTNTATATLATLTTGTFTVTLTVTDSSGASSSASKTVQVNAVGAPTVNVVASATTVAAGTTVNLDGSGSTATAGRTIAGYSWAIVSGASLASFTSATNAATAALQTHGGVSGSFDVRLTVTDSAGVSAGQTVTITVTPVAPIASIFTSARSVFSGARVTFGATGSTAPAGRTITGYQWAVVAGNSNAVISGSSSNNSVSVDTSGTGTFTVQLTVTDSAGAVATATASVDVLASAGGGSDPGGSGGGGLSGLWVALLALAAACLWRARRLQQRRGS